MLQTQRLQGWTGEVLFFSVFITVCLIAVSVSTAQPAATNNSLTPGELRATHAFEAAKKLGPPELYAFLKPMPKGAELHYHLGGGIYAETTLDEAVRQHLSANPALPAPSPPPKPSKTRSSTTVSLMRFPCAASFPVPASLGTTNSSPAIA